MDNNSSFSMFSLTALNGSRSSRITIFSFALPGYFLTIFVNTLLILIIVLEKVLHQPMYIFLCNLCINGLYGATGFYPPLLYYLLSESNVISLKECAIQSFAIFTYAIGEFTNLSVMAFDRYLAICRPLYYHNIMTTVTVWRLLTFIWMFPCCTAILLILMTLRFPICIKKISKLYCETWVLERLVCGVDTAQFVFNGILTCAVNALVWFVFLSYINILVACKHSVQNHKKFISTCLPHLIAFLNYVFWSLFSTLYELFGISSLSQEFKNFLSVTFMIIPPLINPVIYGIVLTPIRTKAKHVFQSFRPKHID
ncbi:odorant receptor 123-1 [Danio rerio]|uniref:Odorant receptor n=1 Tax=Danio rerio TaxID=7955 RepID=Q2PRA7_DANRE|nr:odorant receptor 123-1 [Danio rerio]ABC43360.1 odorant receptor [Danio rerio]|eukprot:NP_001124277.1 odorant receptor, family E, subfamily 123, member 1 [Danio rerio]